MSFLHDVIKINYIRMGYLPNYSYHMISDEEMCDAFMLDGKGYFYRKYPCLDDSLKEPYHDLVNAIQYYINECKQEEVDDYTFPDWVYGYMLGTTLSVGSDSYDIDDLANALNIKVDYGDFSALLSYNCYVVSKLWLSKHASTVYSDTSHDLNLRPPTMFGEPHVLKYLRLNTMKI